MKDLRSSRSLYVLALALGNLLACQAWQANPASTPTVSPLSVTAPSLDFGTVVVGDGGYLREIITNRGSVAFTIRRATVSSPAFTLMHPSFPAVIRPGGGTHIIIRFVPHAAGSFSGVIAIVGSKQSKTVTVKGTAILPGKFSALPSTVSFGRVSKGKTQVKSETFTNRGSTNLTILQATVRNGAFRLTGPSLPLVLAPSRSALFSVAFTPQSVGAVRASLSVTGSASLVGSRRPSARYRSRHPETSESNAMVPLEGIGVGQGQLNTSPLSISFGTAQIGKSMTKSVTLSNAGTSALQITQATVTGPGFRLNGVNLPMTLQAGQRANLNILFSPPAAGHQNGSLTIVTDGAAPVTLVSLTGNSPVPVRGMLSSNLASLTFGSVQVGNAKAQSGILTNSGSSVVTISQASVSGNGFRGTGLVLPLRLDPSESAAFMVTYTPTAPGSGSGSLTLVSDASNPTLAVSLSGTATTAPTPAVLAQSVSNLAFVSVKVGTTTTKSQMLTNTGGMTASISDINVTGAGFKVSPMSLPLKVAAGQNVALTVTYSPTSAGTSGGSLVVVSDASNSSLATSLSGSAIAAPNPGVLGLSSASVNFGSVQVGNTKSQLETVSNSGGSTVSISQANVTSAAFTLSGLDLPMQLNAGESFTFSVIFAPNSAANTSGSLSLVSDASNSVPAVSLSGSGTAAGQLSISPTSLSFGNVTVGSSKSLTATLSALKSNVTISSGGVSDSEFAVSGASFPMTLSAGQSVSLTFTFTPQSSGSASSSLSLATNASNPILTQALAGAGVAAPQHSVQLSWDGSAAGYFLYRGTNSGGPYAKISPSTASNSFTDTSVQSGATYFYVTISVDANGKESDYSNEVRAAIPTP